jgi:hypothetical protein
MPNSSEAAQQLRSLGANVPWTRLRTWGTASTLACWRASSGLRGLPQDRHAAAALLLVREAMHHLRYDELRTVVDVHSQGSRKRVGSSSRPPMELPMQDESVLQHITKLVEEERDLVSSAAPVAEKEARLKHVGEELDRCWDLLRQRRAKREFGGDPDSAHVRDTRTVEGYEG